ncbi:Deblocking aminopeptidase [Clostridiaceae bacterium JG1575]|nr:Deblocking aminopeptidase [Clostridiaceae bacterium JG1575]
MTDVPFIESLCAAFGPSGFEEEPVHCIKEYLPGFEITEDAMHNLYIPHPGNQGNRPLIQLDAHLDEVGFMVQSIHDNGTLSFVPLGGWVPSNVPAHTVRIRTATGRMVQGIVASKPPHFMSAKERAADQVVLEDLVIDVGSSSREETLHVYGIAPGDPVAPLVASHYEKDTDILFGKAFDNRLGCAAVAEVLHRLRHEELPVDLVGALASQEEVGMRGAAVTSQVLRPDFAIVFEGSPADDLYFSSAEAQGALKKGVQIRHLDASYISSPAFLRFAGDTAKAQGIPTQHAIRRAGSTNAGRISITGKAVPCLVLGIPSRFIHTHYNHAALADLEAAIELACAILTSFPKEGLRL